WSNIWGQKLYKVQDGITETNHGVLEYLVVTSVAFLNSLPPDVRHQLLDILHQVTLERNAEVTAVEAASRQAILDAGGTIRTLTPAERQAWVTAMKPVWAHFLPDVSQANIDAAQTINARF
ncbi:MAG: C4-dicarboxylate ABC transporter, partial [Paracoccaceae bacterium]|nr:C4-dicarboxylate ABC transporter [Paracoccaceae bacterium]